MNGLKDLYADFFKIGVACESIYDHFTNNEIGNPDKEKLMLQEFNSMTFGNELKPAYNMGWNTPEATEEYLPFVINPEAKRMLDFARSHGMKVRGHVLVWHSQCANEAFCIGYKPITVPTDPEILKTRPFMKHFEPLKPECFVSRDTMLKRLNSYIRSCIKYMYKNGYAVEKDYERYKMIIERLYIRLKRDNFRRGPVSDVLTRYARIRADEGKIDEAVSTYKTAKEYLAGRLEWNGFFGDRNVMKWMIGDMYKITKPDMDNLDLYDLYYLLTKPWKGYIVTTDEKIAIESVIEGEACVIRYGDKWFRDTDDFFARAEIYGERITAHYYDISVYEDADR